MDFLKHHESGDFLSRMFRTIFFHRNKANCNVDFGRSNICPLTNPYVGLGEADGNLMKFQEELIFIYSSFSTQRKNRVFFFLVSVKSNMQSQAETVICRLHFGGIYCVNRSNLWPIEFEQKRNFIRRQIVAD